jgi:hypothetical protein
VVSQLITPEKSSWDMDLLKNFFDVNTVNAIQNIPIATSALADRWTWTKTNTGKFSVKSAYWLIGNSEGCEDIDQLKSSIWKRQLHKR